MKIKDIIKSEVETELKNLVDLAIEQHSKIVSINQIQRVPDNKIDAFKNELKGLKDMMSDFVQREHDMTDRFHKFDKMVPEFNLKINNLLMDMNFKANSEDINKLYGIIPKLVTKDD
jgi:DNA-directed RNA polymerase subunit F